MKKSIILIAATFITLFTASCSKNEVPEIHQEFTTKNLWFKLPPSPNDSMKFFVQVNTFTDHVSTVSFIHIDNNNVWNQYGYFINNDGECTDTEHYVYAGISSVVPSHDTIVNFRSIPFSRK